MGPAPPLREAVMEAVGPVPPLGEVMSHKFTLLLYLMNGLSSRTMSHTLCIPDEWLGTSNMLHTLIILLKSYILIII